MLTWHAAPHVAQVRAMLAFAPERLGHAVSAASDAGLLPSLLACGAPVELCLTSNVLSRSVPSYGCARCDARPPLRHLTLTP